MIELLEQVAQRLSGKKVAVVLRSISERNVGGYTHRTASGGIQITLKPTMDDETFLRLFLHEAAHCKLHSERMRAIGASPEATRQRAAFLRQRTDKVALAQIDQVTKRQEREADDLAARWLHLAEVHQAPGGSWLVSRLNGLLTSYTVN